MMSSSWFTQLPDMQHLQGQLSTLTKQIMDEVAPPPAPVKPTELSTTRSVQSQALASQQSPSQVITAQVMPAQAIPSQAVQSETSQNPWNPTILNSHAMNLKQQQQQNPRQLRQSVEEADEDAEFVNRGPPARLSPVDAAFLGSHASAAVESLPATLLASMESVAVPLSSSASSLTSSAVMDPAHFQSLQWQTASLTVPTSSGQVSVSSSPLPMLPSTSVLLSPGRQQSSSSANGLPPVANAAKMEARESAGLHGQLPCHEPDHPFANSNNGDCHINKYIVDLERDLAELRERHRDQVADLEARHRQDIQSYEEAVESLQSELDRLQLSPDSNVPADGPSFPDGEAAKVLELESRLESVSRERDALIESLQDEQQKRSAIESSTKHELGREIQRVRKLEAMLKKAQEAASTASQHSTDTQLEAEESLRRQLDSLREEHGRLKADLEVEFQSQLEQSLSQKVASWSAMRLGFETQLRESTARLHDLQITLDKERDQWRLARESWDTDREQQRHLCADLERQVTNWKQSAAKGAQFQEQVAALQEQISQSQSTTMAMEEERKQSTSRIQELENQLVEYSARLKTQAQQEEPLVLQSNDETYELERSQAEIQRLRTHLAELETSHTEELMELSSQIDDYRRQLDKAQGVIGNLESLMREQSDDNGLLEQYKSERDSVVIKCHALNDENEQLKSQLDNVQAVLDGYELAKRSELELVVGSLQNQVSNLKKDLFRAQDKLSKAEAALEKFGLSPDEVTALKVKCDEQSQVIDTLQMQVSHLSTALSSTLPPTDPAQPAYSSFARLQSPRLDEFSIDKRVVSKILMQLFSTPSSDPRRDELLYLLTSMLDFDESMREKVGLIQDENGIWKRRRSQRPVPDKNVPPPEVSELTQASDYEI